jgi:phosphatidylserine/phosphatidylglycerophosphate/cardiolipin synthase-like enzyme
VIELVPLHPGAQTALELAQRVAAFVGEARRSLDLALYDVRLPGIPDLMHHKYVVRDGEAVWTGSTNWTTDSWTLQENVIVLTRSASLAAEYARNFEEL